MSSPACIPSHGSECGHVVCGRSEVTCPFMSGPHVSLPKADMPTLLSEPIASRRWSWQAVCTSSYSCCCAPVPRTFGREACTAAVFDMCRACNAVEHARACRCSFGSRWLLVLFSEVVALGGSFFRQLHWTFMLGLLFALGILTLKRPVE